EAGDAAPWLELQLAGEHEVGEVVLKEQITEGQRIEGVRISVPEGEGWRPVATTTAVGYQRIVELEPVRTDRLRVEVTAFRQAPTLAAAVPRPAGATPAA